MLENWMEEITNYFLKREISGAGGRNQQPSQSTQAARASRDSTWDICLRRCRFWTWKAIGYWRKRPTKPFLQTAVFYGEYQRANFFFILTIFLLIGIQSRREPVPDSTG